MVSCAILAEVISFKKRGYKPSAEVLEEFLGKLALRGFDTNGDLNPMVAIYLVRVIFDDGIYGLNLTAQLTDEDSPVGLFLSQLGNLPMDVLHSSNYKDDLLSRTHCEYRKFLKETALTYSLGHAPLYVHNLRPSLVNLDVVLETSFGDGATGRIIYTKNHKTHLDAMVDAASSFSLQGTDVNHIANILAYNNRDYPDSGSTEQGIMMLIEAFTRTALDEHCIKELSKALKDYQEIMSQYMVTTANINISFTLRPTSFKHLGGIGLFDLKYVYHQSDIIHGERIRKARRKMREFIALGDARVGLYVTETIFPVTIICLATSFLVVGILVAFEIGLVKLGDARSANFLSFSAIVSSAALSISPKLLYSDWEYRDFLHLRRKTYSLLDFCNASSWDFQPSKTIRTVNLKRIPSFRRSKSYLSKFLKSRYFDRDDWNSIWHINLTMSEIYTALASFHDDGSLDLSGPFSCMLTTEPKGGISIDLCPRLMEFIHTTSTLIIQPSRQTVEISIHTAFNKRNLTLELSDRTLTQIHHAVPDKTILQETPTYKFQKNILIVEAQVVGLAPVLLIRVG